MVIVGTSPPGSDFDASPVVRICDLPFTALSESACVTRLLARLGEGLGTWVITPNLDIVRQCKGDAEVAELVGTADMLVADGMPLVWASALQRTRLPERIAGSSLIVSLSAAAARADVSVFLLGGNPGTADGAAAELRRRCAGLRVVGTHCPPFGFEKDAEQTALIETKLRDAKPDIVYVALGFPKAERLICRLRNVAPAAIWVGVGISFSFLCGEVAQAPPWLRNIGLEWVHRMVQEPRRLVRRYLVHDLPFAGELFYTAWRARRRSSGPGSG
ncbi:MAG: WecB/TagA/CpsF family glycosyltransferase [Nannocystaceae bacterium]